MINWYFFVLFPVSQRDQSPAKTATGIGDSKPIIEGGTVVQQTQQSLGDFQQENNASHNGNETGNVVSSNGASANIPDNMTDQEADGAR